MNRPSSINGDGEASSITDSATYGRSLGLMRFLFPDFPALHRIAFPVVSEWCQEDQLPSLTFQAQVDWKLLLMFRLCS